MSYRLVETHPAEVLLNRSLIQAHHDELKMPWPLDPDIERFTALYLQWSLFVLALYYGDELIGYSFNFIDKHLHSKDLTVCVNELLYVNPVGGHRSTMWPAMLMSQTKVLAKQRGAAFMQWHTVPGTPLGRTLLRRVPVFEEAYIHPL